MALYLLINYPQCLALVLSLVFLFFLQSHKTLWQLEQCLESHLHRKTNLYILGLELQQTTVNLSMS